MENNQLTQEYLDTYYFEMFSKAGENACRSIVSAAWKKIAGSKRVTGQEMYDYVKARMDVVAAKHGEVWDTEPREKIFHLVYKKGKEYDYDFGEYFGTGF